MANCFGFDEIIKNLARVKSSELPLQVANVTKNYFNSAFKEQAWDGKAWQPVKRVGKAGSQRNNSQALVQSGKLRRAVNNSLKTATFSLIEFNVTDATAKNGFNYAGVHNFGLKAGRGKGFIMPKRQFMPNPGEEQPADLTQIQMKKISSVVDKIWER